MASTLSHLTEDARNTQEIGSNTTGDLTKVACTQDENKSGIFEIIAITFGVSIFLTNTIVVVAIARGGKKLQKATFYCICNLAVADLLAGLLLLWVFGLQKVALSSRTANSELIQKSIWVTTVWSSLLSQIVISIDRYGHVTRCNQRHSSGVKGFKWGSNKRRQLVLTGIALTWIIPIVTFVTPVITFWNCKNSCACYIENNSRDVIYMWCFPSVHCSQVNPAFSKSSMLYLGLILLLMPLIPISLYLQIYLFVRSSSRKLGNTMKKPTRASCSTYNKDLTSKETSSGKNDVFVSKPIVNGENKSRANIMYSPRDSMKNMKQKIIPKRFSVRLSSRGDSEPRFSQSCNETEKNISKSSLLSKSSKRNQDRDMKLMRTLMIILALFVISTVPLGVLFVASYTVTDKRYLSAVKAMLTMSLFNSLLNPWVYVWRFAEMRIAIRKLFCRCCTNNSPLCSSHCSLATSSERRKTRKANRSLVGHGSSDSISKQARYSHSKEPHNSSSSAF